MAQKGIWGPFQLDTKPCWPAPQHILCLCHLLHCCPGQPSGGKRLPLSVSSALQPGLMPGPWSAVLPFCALWSSRTSRKPHTPAACQATCTPGPRPRPRPSCCEAVALCSFVVGEGKGVNPDADWDFGPPPPQHCCISESSSACPGALPRAPSSFLFTPPNSVSP